MIFQDIITLEEKTLYLDTDTIVTGNIEEIWNYWDDISEAEGLLAGLIPNTLPGDSYNEIFRRHFAPIKHVPPCGVNGGVMFMHLEKMRVFDWTKKIGDLFNQPSSNLTDDQRLINALFHDHLGLISIFLLCSKACLLIEMTKN